MPERRDHPARSEISVQSASIAGCRAVVLRHVRHPIYSGIMLAMIGSALAVGLFWLALFVLYFAYFLVSARTEEKMMLAQFPDAYPAYRRRTKMLIPFLF